ncbi:uncharacterized protein LOC106095074 [Stomoxys calcitrans]|uniref:uncharacterized protein LOC106095074 n=1 Tax=Stomoxys calcitrans TaxID=35570 RepID=UPI0027E27708|nr:uncharacterized protein LOC106095074 [Stomoxys calcitrans]
MLTAKELQRHAHAQHRKRVQEAKTIIDTKAPLLHAGNFSGFSKMKDDIQTFRERHKTNAQLLVRMNEIFRLKGVTDCFRTKETAATPSSIPRRIKEMEKIESTNMILGKRILCVKPELDTWQKIKKPLKARQEKPNHQPKFLIPWDILKKYSSLNVSKYGPRLDILMRPKIWLEVSIKEVCPVGRLVIHLHTEAAPAVVLELMRLCGNHHNNSLSFVKIFPSLWLEAQLQLGDKTMLCRTLEYDKRALDHGNYAGVLSFSLDHLNLLEEDKETSLMFAISFRPLGLLNGRRVGFGHVIEGLDILNFIQAYGTKNGKPTKEFVVSKCGVFVN